MFLNQLSTIEKEKFLELAYLLASSDGDFSSEEQEIMKVFRKEMDLPEANYKISNDAFEEIIVIFSKSSEQIKKIVLLEALGIVLCDKVYSGQEKKMMNKLRESLSLSKDIENEFIDWINNINQMYQNISSIIYKD